MTEKEYEKLVQKAAPKSPIGKDCLNAFWIGGLICTLGQVFMNCYGALGMEKQDAGTAASMTLVALSALLTGFSVYDDIAKYAGAGTLVTLCLITPAETQELEKQPLLMQRGISW